MRDGAHGYVTNELAPDPSKSVVYNAGFSAGYLGLPLKGHHTQQYLLGYINGTLYESNRGVVFGYNGLPKDKDVLYEKGNNLFKLGNYTGARTALQLRNKCEDIYYQKASHYRLFNYTNYVRIGLGV